MTTINRALTLVAATAITATTLVACSTDSTTEAPAKETTRATSSKDLGFTTETPVPATEDAPAPQEKTDDLTTVDAGTPLHYKGSGEYNLTFGDLTELDDKAETFAERWVCSDRSIGIDRYGLPNKPDGFLAGWVYGDNVGRATIHKQATLATPRFRAYAVTDGTVDPDKLQSWRLSRDVPRVNHHPDSSTSTECFGAIPKDADQLYIEPNFGEARVTSYEATKDDKDIDGWLINLPAWDH